MGTQIAEKKKGGAVQKWDAQMAKYAKEASENEQSLSGQFISTKGGVLTVAGQEIEGNEADILILDHCYENTFYEGDYDADNPQSPVCFALSRINAELKPHENSGKPQHSQCEGCPQNEFGTAERGKGKACKNIRRIALISADRLSPKSVAESELFFYRIPVTSVKGWAGYVKGLAANTGRPPFGVVTTMKVIRHEKDQYHVNFTLKEPLDQKSWLAAEKRHHAIKEEVMFPYAKNEGGAPAKSKKKDKKAKKKGKF